MGTEPDDSIDLETAAGHLGVHYQTVYRWVRTGVLPAVRLATGYRIDPADVATMAAVRQARRPLAYTGRARDWDRLREQLHTALVAADDTAARRVFEMVHLARVPILDQCEELLTANLSRIGDEWAAGELSAARVRVAAGICERSLSWAIGRLDVSGPAAGVALVVTPRGEDHRLPALMAGAVLRNAGWIVREVHGVVPADVASLADRLNPNLAVVSMTVPDVGDAAEEVRVDLGGRLGVPVLIGGAGKSLQDLHAAAMTLSQTAA